MYAWTLSIFRCISANYSCRLSPDTLCSFSIRTALLLTSLPQQQCRRLKLVQPPASCSQIGASSPSGFWQLVLPSSLSLPCHVRWTLWCSFIWSLGTLVMCNLAMYDRILHSCGFLLFFFFLQVLNIFLFGSSGDRYVTVGLTSNQVNSSSAHVQPASPPLSWDPTLTSNLTMLQKFL